MKKDSSYKHIFKYTGLFGGVQGLNILIGLVRNKVIAVLLGPAGVGLISIYNTASTLIQNATNFGIQTSGIREISQAFDSGDDAATKSTIKILRSWSMLVAILGGLVCFMLSRVLSDWAFNTTDHTADFMLLAPVVAMAAIAGGETAILKATRRLKNLAVVSVVGAFFALLVSLPLFWMWGQEAIIPSIIIIAVIQMLLAMFYSYRFYPLSLTLRKQELSKGTTMLTVGTAFVVAGVMGSGAEFLIRAYLSDISVSLAGLYNAGYMITVTYAGLVFAAMETDYFPHLSAVCNDVEKMNGAANRQIEVSLMIVGPLLVALLVGTKLLIPILFSQKFIPVIGMTQVAVLAMYFRGVNLPVAYITLAKGDSAAYMCLEAVYDILLVFTIVFGYTNWGLTGTGIALLVTTAIDTLCVISYCAWKYDFSLSDTLLIRIVVHIFIGALSLSMVLLFDGILYWILAIVLVCISTGYSYHMFKNKVYA